MATKKKAKAATRSPAQLAYDKRRAAAKKAAAKAPAKKATKRVVAKKASPLKGRKLGPRKTKAETVVEQPQVEVNVAEKAPEEVFEELDLGAELNAPERPDYFDQVDIIDLRNSDIRATFALITALEARGFITDQTGNLLDPRNIDGIFHADGLRLFHKNKLVALVSSEEINNSAAVSFPCVQQETVVTLTEPQPMLPNVIEQNGAVYARIA